MFTNRSFHLLIMLVLFAVTACVPQSTPASEQPEESSAQQVWSITGDPNPFKMSHGIAVDPQGSLYVMASLNHRIQKFDGDGRLMTMWGGFGDGDGQFKCLNYCMVAVDKQGNIYITDHNNYRIQKFDGDGKLWRNGAASAMAMGSLVTHELRTLMVGITVFGSRYNRDIPVAMTGMLLASLPMFILYLFGQRYFIKGMLAGALKG